MTEFFHNWYSPILGRDFQMLEFGHGGQPVIVFPSSMGRYFEAKDRGLIQSAHWFLQEGKVRIYCPDSIDELSWYNKGIHPAERAHNHGLYDQMVLQELVERIKHETGYEKVVVSGCSFGGYHAANFAFRHPEKVRALFSMSGAFDIKSQVDGYYDDNVYFHNPMDYLPDANHPDLWNLHIVLGLGEHDICRGQNEHLSQLLNQKNISHWLDIRPGAVHDWPIWLEMFPHYLSLL